MEQGVAAPIVGNSKDRSSVGCAPCETAPYNVEPPTRPPIGEVPFSRARMCEVIHTARQPPAPTEMKREAPRVRQSPELSGSLAFSRRGRHASADQPNDPPPKSQKGRDGRLAWTGGLRLLERQPEIGRDLGRRRALALCRVAGQNRAHRFRRQPQAAKPMRPNAARAMVDGSGTNVTWSTTMPSVTNSAVV